MLITAISLLPLSAAALAASLAWVAWREWRGGNRIVLFFLLLNIATFLWSASYAIELNLTSPAVLDVAPVGSAAYFLFVIEMLGIAAAPTYWFLFCAAYARKSRWVDGWRLWLAHVPMIYTLAVMVTNPLHQLFVSHAGQGVPSTYGPLAIPHLLGTQVLVVWGIWLIVTASWRRGTPASRRQAVVLAVASLMPFLGGMAWALRSVLGLPLTVNPVPILFSVLNLVLLYQVLRHGFGDIVSVAARQAFHTMADAVLVINADGFLVASNPAAELLLPEVKTGKRLREVAPAIAERAEECLSTDEYLEFELEVADTVQWGRVRRTLDRRDASLGCIILLTDVTDLRAAQSGLEKTNAELQQRVHELAEANTELDEVTHAKSLFLASMSHELRTPLNSIIGFSGVLLQGLAGEINPVQRRQLKMISSSGKRLLAQVNDILDLTRIESGKVTVSLESTALRPVLDSALDQTNPFAQEKGITLTLRTPAEDVTVVTDAQRLEHILVNLMTNAIKFTDIGGVVLEVVPNGRRAELRVIDTGIGIPEAALGRIFTEFERVEPADGVSRPGTGLGLSICRGLATLIDATLSAESTVGEGSTFTVSVPRDHPSARVGASQVMLKRRRSAR